MKSILTLAALVGMVACSTANAASLKVVTNGTTNSIYLLGEAQNGTFNTVKLDVTPNGAGTFTALSSGAGKVAADANTFRNRVLDGDPLDGGLGWSLVGTSTTATSLGFSGGPLGSNITTAAQPNGELFLGNVTFTGAAENGIAKVQLSDAVGAIIADLQTTVPVPEPATCGLLGMALLGLVAARRRS